MRFSIVFLLTLVSLISSGQFKQMSLKDAVYGRYTYLKPKILNGILWKDATTYSYVENDTLWGFSAKNEVKTNLIDLNEINQLLKIEIENKFEYFPNYLWLKDGSLLIQLGNNFFVVDINKNILVDKIALPPVAENAVFNSPGQFVSFTVGDNLFVRFADGKSVQITTDGGNGIVNGQTVHRNEFGITGGIFNSPKGNFIAFYRKDESMVHDYPLVNFMAREAEYTPVKYPMAGMVSHEVKLGVYNIKSGKTVFLETGEPLDHYLTNVVWSPDEKYIYMAELNRGQNHMQLNCYDAISGEKIKTLFEEKSNTYVEPLTPIRFSKVIPGEFYFLSRRDGWMHLYKSDTSGKQVRQITKGKWEVTDLLGFDPKEKSAFFAATKESPLERQIYKVEIKSGKIEKLTSEAGMHSALFSPGSGYFIDDWSAPEVPHKTDLVSAKGKKIKNLLTAKNPLTDYQLGKTTLVTLKTRDGKSALYGRLIKPVNFDPQKKYPVIVYVYGGPHSQLVNNGWHYSARWWQYYMASKGYVAFTLDNRGTSFRGRAFENVIHRHLGILETEDQMQGIAYLKSLPFVDTTRIGVHGWSYGGFMTLNLKLRHPETFKVAVAGGPVVDWSMYEIMYGERYMDTPQENPEGYKEASMVNHISTLNGKLLIVHDMQDKTVVAQQSMKFLRECVKQGKQVDFFTYPTHPHNVQGIDRVHLMEKVSNYFFGNL